MSAGLFSSNRAEKLAHCLSSFLLVERGFISSQKKGGVGVLP